MNGSALYSDVVLPAATWYEKHDLSSTDLHPFVHSFNPAIPPPWETRTDFDVFKRIAESFTRLAEKHLGVRRDLVAAPLLHDTPDELAQPLGKVLDWKAGECEPVPGKTMPKLVVVERDYGAVLDKWLALGPLVEELGIGDEGDRLEAARRGRGAAAAATADGATAARASPATSTGARRSSRLSGVTNGRLARRGLPRRSSSAPACRSPTSPTSTPTTRIAFGDTQVQPRKVIASPEWSGMESRERRYSPFTINVERRRPVADADRAPAVLRRPRVAARVRRGPARLPAADRRDPPRRRAVLRRAGPRRGARPLALAALEVVDPLRVPGQPAHARPSSAAARSPGSRSRTRRRSASRDNDWVEVFNRNGVIACRAVVSHRIPKGVGLMYHSQDRHVNVPKTRALGDARRHRQLGHADLDQADAPRRRLRAALLRLQLLRPDRPAARRAGRRPQAARRSSTDARQGAGRDGDEPRQVHRLPHLLGHLQERLDEPARRRVHVVQRRRDEARASATRSAGRTRSSGAAAGSSTAAGSSASRPAAPLRKLANLFFNPDLPTLDDYYEPWTYDYETLTTAPVAAPPAGRAARVAAHRQAARPAVGARTGRTTSPARPSARPPTRTSATAPRSRCGSSSSRRSCSTSRASASTASTPPASPPARRARCTSARRTGSSSSTRTRAAAGGCASAAAPTRRSTSTGRAARPRSARSATRGSRPASRRSARRPASAGSATSASSSTTPTASRRPPPSPTRRTCSPRSSRSSSTRTTPRCRRRPAATGSPRTGSTPRAARRSTRSPSSTASRCRSIPSTGRCRWSGTCRRSRR